MEHGFAINKFQPIGTFWFAIKFIYSHIHMARVRQRKKEKNKL